MLAKKSKNLQHKAHHMDKKYFLPDGFVQPFQVRDEQREDLIVHQSLRIKNILDTQTKGHFKIFKNCYQSKDAKHGKKMGSRQHKS
jgi:hypothetical protein